MSRTLSELDQVCPHRPPAAARPVDAAVKDNGRSPLQRFRSFPCRPLSVSDLTSGAWCELQFWYTLTRLPGGRRTRTAAMRQGSRVHQKLEDQVHTAVPVDVASKEDGFALRLWNLIQGLRTLRDTGLTRELEVWGTVDGNLVNGVIDSLSYELEQELPSQGSQPNRQQSVLTDYLPPGKKMPPSQPRKVHLADVKTRGSLVPVSKSVLRPAKMQLLLYHRFLADMAAGKLDFEKVLHRYGLDQDARLTDGFLAQVGDMHDDVFYDAPSNPDDAEASAPTGSLPGEDLVRYQTLREMLPLVRGEMELTFPQGAASVSNTLRVQYMHRADGRLLDVHDFTVSAQALDAYLDRYMAWWRGERPARGVEIEEAFKCGSCEFAADCSWRGAMDEERLSSARARARLRHEAAPPP